MKIGELEVSKIYLGSAEIEKIYLGTSEVYEEEEPTPPTPVPYDEQYLTIESTSDNNTILLVTRYIGITRTISASTDNGQTWTAYTSTTGGTQIASLNIGDKVLLKGENAQYNKQGTFKSTTSFITYGNVMSLVYGDNFAGQTTLTSGDTFGSLFSGCTGLISAENLVLPATTLTNGCYQYMFAGCTSLTTGPVLPATTLASNCYMNMFTNCTSLTTGPVLPATTLADWCYMEIFEGCTNLSYIKCLATDISAMDCTILWVDGVSPTGTFVKAASMNDWIRDDSDGIPNGWTIQNA